MVKRLEVKLNEAGSVSRQEAAGADGVMMFEGARAKEALVIRGRR